MGAVLRICGLCLDVDECLKWISTQTLTHVWRVGDVPPVGAPSTTSGFNLLLSDADDRRVVPEAVDALRSIAPQVSELIRRGASGEVDFEMFVAPDEPMSIVLEPTVLQTISEVGVGIVVSAYPVAQAEDCDE
jgi:hypothetical protein